MITNTSFSVKNTEIDHMGIVHHSNYPKWFEKGRKDYLNKAGIPNSKIFFLGFFLPLSEMKCKYIIPAKFGDEINLITSIIYLSCVKIKFQYKVLNKKNGKVLAIGNTVHALTNKKIEPLNIQKEAPKIYELLLQLVEPLDIT